MADIVTKKISEFDAPLTIEPTNLIPVSSVENAETYAATAEQIKEFVLDTPTLTGEATAETPPLLADDQRIATTEFVQALLGSLGLSPATNTEYGTVRTNSTDAVPVVYLKSEIDTLLSALTSSISNLIDTKIDAIIQPGSIMAVYGDTAPFTMSGWELCDGRYLSRTTYSRLFAKIGTYFGTTTASNFRLPDLRGRSIFGAADFSDTDFFPYGVGGARTHTLTEAEMPNHRHETNVQLLAGGIGSSANVTVGGGGYQLITNPGTTFVGGNQAHNNLPPYATAYYFIRV